MFTPRETADVVIVGGGVIGLSIARALAQRGVRDLVVIEKGRFGREASWAAGGTLAPQIEADRCDDFFRLACASRDSYCDFAKTLEDETGVDVQLDTTGTLYVAFTAEEETKLWSRCAWQQSQQFNVEWLGGDDARGIEPCLSENVRGALRFPHDYQVENRRLCEALFIANQKLGVHLIDNCEAHSLRIKDRTVQGIETSGGFVESHTIVIAAGAWTSMITSPGNVHIEPVRGQMLCFEASQFVRHVIYSSRGYLVPRHDGRLLAGSTIEEVGFDRRVTDEGINAIKSMAIEIAPAIERMPLIDSWAGFRPRAEDGLPVLGASADIEGLYYATGHYRNGILLAPITGELIAETIVNGESASLLKPFSPNRFLRNHKCQNPER